MVNLIQLMFSIIKYSQHCLKIVLLTLLLILQILINLED